MRLRRVRAVWWVTAAVVVAGATAAVVAVFTSGNGTSAAAAGSTAQVQRGTVSTVVSASGTVVASATRGLSFSMAGTVTELNVKAGDQVSAGQVLARIDDTDAQSAVDSARSRVASDQDALARAEQAASPSPSPTAANCSALAPAALRVGDGPGAPSASPTPSSGGRSRTTPPATTTPAGGSGTAGGQAGRSDTAGGQAGRSDTAGGQAGGGQGGGSTGCAAGRSGNGGTGRGGTGASGTGTDAIFAAQQQLNNANLALRQAERKLAGTVVTAPIDGRVLSVGGALGSSESPGNTGFIVLSSVSDTEVSASFTEADVARLAVGQPATITLPDRDGAQFTGTVAEVSPAGTASDRLVKYPVLIAFDQVPDDLLYGQSAAVVVTTGSVSGVLYVPSSAVTGIGTASGTSAGTGGGDGTSGTGSDRTGVVTVRASGHDQRRTVRIGLRGDRYTEIRAGLTLGDTVVIGGR